MTGAGATLHWIAAGWLRCRRHATRTIAIAGWLLAAGCARESGAPVHSAHEEAQRGAAALRQYGCGACHRIAGIAGAEGVVGPPLVDMARRVYIGRGLPNTRENMIRWIRTPQEFAPRSAMPDMQVTATDAADMTAYLYRLR